MFHSHTHKGFSLIELVLCMGLLLIALPLIWMVISLISTHMLRMTVQTERDKTVYLLVTVLDRCISVSENTIVGTQSIFTSAGSMNCTFQSSIADGTTLFINSTERIFSSYQSKITFSNELDQGNPRQVSVIFTNQGRNIFTYTFYEQES